MELSIGFFCVIIILSHQAYYELYKPDIEEIHLVKKTQSFPNSSLLITAVIVLTKKIIR